MDEFLETLERLFQECLSFLQERPDVYVKTLEELNWRPYEEFNAALIDKHLNTLAGPVLCDAWVEHKLALCKFQWLTAAQQFAVKLVQSSPATAFETHVWLVAEALQFQIDFIDTYRKSVAGKESPDQALHELMDATLEKVKNHLWQEQPALPRDSGNI